MKNVLKTSNQNHYESKGSPWEFTHKPEILKNNPEYREDEIDSRQTGIDVHLQNQVISWLMARGVRRGDPSQIVEQFKDTQRKKLQEGRENIKPEVKPGVENNALLARRLKKKLMVNI